MQSLTKPIMTSSGGDSAVIVRNLLISETDGLIAGVQQPLTRKTSVTVTLLVIEQELNID